MFSPSDFRELFQPNYCERRIWLNVNCPELAVKDTDFIEMVQEKGLAVEKAHVQTVGPTQEPEYEKGDMPAGYEATLRLIESKVPIIYQGVLISKDGQFGAIPDLIILNSKTNEYRIQEIKLATNIDNHPEIELGVGLSKFVAEEILGYPTITEIVTGDGSLISPFDAPDKSHVVTVANKIIGLETLEKEPVESVGWSKCKDCQYGDYCYDKAWQNRSICTISGIEKGMVWALWENGVDNWDQIIELGVDKLYGIQFQRGSQIQKIGPTRGGKIFRQTKCLVEGSFDKKADIILPAEYQKGDRPIVIFDIENTVFDELEFDVDVYMWGLITILPDGTNEQNTVIAPPGDQGDAEGWTQFLETMGRIFEKYGDIPVIHFSSHEVTKINSYIARYGDKDSIGKRVKNNMWDLYCCILDTVILPVPSYGLKQIENFVGFKRSQEEYGGSWSMVKYNEYAEAPDVETADKILNEIKTYNAEDLLATYAVYRWLEENIC